MSDTRTIIGQPGSAAAAAAGEPSFASALPPAERERVAVICGLLDDLGCDEDTRAAAWWYALAATQPQEWARQGESLSEDVRRLVDGQQQAETVWRLYRDHGGRGGAEGLRRLLLAIIRDLRVVYLLLSRQLATMRAASRWPEAGRRELAALTADIHAPLANRLGIWQWKWELEDLAFRYLQPDTYKRIARLLDERRGDREAYIRRCVRELETALRKEGIAAEVAGRPKHIHSIWKKMQRKGVGFGELYDIRALRVLVDGIGDCYAALGVTHTLWPNVPGEFDDYIARPKGNDYRSLHTAVIGPEGRTLEVQIRTREMHRAAELGVAAHWRYKEGGGGDAAYQARVAWMRRLLEAREEDGGDGALLAGLRGELAEDRVYLLTPKGEVFDLAAGATVLDFAYHVHSMVGHRCRGAKVNGRIVPLTHQPVSGDRVEILTGKQPEPRRDWLVPQQGFLRTASARGKVRAWFRRSDNAANLAAGRQILERELKRLALGERAVERVHAKLGLKSHDDLLVALALGEIGSGQVARALGEAEAPAQTALPVRGPGRKSPEKPGALVIEGVGNLLTALARCCQPLPGDVVAGFITRGRGVTVHRADCASLARLRARAPERVIEVDWGATGARAYEVQIAVTGYDRKNLHKDITTIIANAGAQIAYSDSRADVARGEVRMHFGLRLHDFAELSALLARLSALPNVIDAHRLAAR
ncbi:MAG TPA: bifunctional (p)ppGpp synthetase/guanosine-3',5'-bis(diphosphate) 3'-pyrophosphohydrolase [Rhodanobacteraceae bacterium]|nr:bifunctional (p)ppGpp synthetase/guanosine-3',5'-bis(diphosphate) 3'-pyrophosphohydrolase [Rhodanobacteraceae bacterium]